MTKANADGIAAKNAKKETKKYRWYRRFMVGKEPPSRYWTTNLTKQPSQREALSCFVQSLRFLFLRFLRLFAAISASVFVFASWREIFVFDSLLSLTTLAV